jgi:hypothetical protein
MVSENPLTCIVHYAHGYDTSIQPVTANQFRIIREAVTLRQTQDDLASRLDEICALVPNEADSSVHGIHKWCFKKFTNVTKLRNKIPSTDPAPVVLEPVRTSSRASSGNSNSSLFPQDQCLFCGKERKRVRNASEYLAKCVTECAESSIRTAAEVKQDFTMLGKIQGVDLRAKEARYHNSCRREYIRLDNNSMVSVEVDSSGTTVPSYKNDPIKMAYHDAFESLCDYVTRSVIQGRQIERMKMLHDRLQQYMETKHPQHYNPNHTSQKLKKKLIKRFAEQLSFRAPQDPTKSEIVFSSQLQIGDAVEAAFESMASEKYVLQTAAAILRRNIKVSCSNSKLVQWPPTAGTLQSSEFATGQFN